MPKLSLVRPPTLAATIFLWIAPLGAQTPEEAPHRVEMVVHAEHAGLVMTLAVDVEHGVFITGGTDGVRIWRDGRLRRTLPGHLAALSPDGKHLVTATKSFFRHGEENPIRVFDAKTYELLSQFDPGGGLRSLLFTPDGTQMLTCCLDDKEAHLRRFPDGELVHRLEAPPSDRFNPLYGSVLKLSGDGRRVVAQTFEGVVVWDVASGHAWPLLPLENYSDFRFDVSHDGRRIVAGGAAPELAVWDLADDGEVMSRLLSGHTESIVDVDMTADGRFAVTSSGDRTARLWDLDRGVELGHQEHPDAIGEVAISASGKLAFYNAGGWYPSQWLWHTATGKRQNFISPDRTTATLPRFSADEQVVHAVGSGRPISWDTVTREPLSELVDSARRQPRRATITRLAITPDAGTLIVGHRDYLRLWDLETGDVSTHDGAEFLFSPDGSYLALGPVDGRVEIWRLATRRVETELSHDAPLRAVAASPDGALLVTAAADGSLHLWDPLDGRLLDHWRSRETGIRKVAVTADGRFVFAAAAGGRIEVWDRHGSPASGGTPSEPTVAAVLEHATDEDLRFLELEPSGRYLLSAAGNESVFFAWDLQNGFLRHQLTPGSSVVGWGFAGEHTVVTAAAGKEVAVAWDLEGNRRRQVFAGHQEGIETLAVRPDGRQLLTGSKDGTARLWDLETGAELRRLSGHAGAVTAVAWSPAGDLMLSADEDGAIRLWDAQAQAPGDGLPVARLYSGTTREWAVLGNDGRWDAADGGRIDGVTVWDGERPWPLSGFHRGYTPGLLGEIMAPRLAHNRSAAPPKPVRKTSLAEREPPTRDAVAELPIVGRAPIGATVTGIAYRAPYAYAVQSGLFLVVDVSDPARPRLVGQLSLPVTTTHSVAVHNGFAYVSGSHLSRKIAAVVVDVRDATAPRIATILEGDCTSWSLAVDDGLLFIAMSSLDIYDLSDPEQPELIHRHRLGSGYAHSVTVAGGLAYVGKGDFGLDIVDVRDPTQPRHLTTVPAHATVYHVAVNRTRAAFHTGSDVILLDVTEPRWPVETARLSSPAVRALALRNESLVIADAVLGFRRFDLRDPAHPRLIAQAVSATDEKGGSALVWTGEHWLLGAFGEGLAVVADQAGAEDGD